MRHGYLLVHKEVGPTSHDVVARVRSALNEPKIGHLGTLDPMAGGLLVLEVGAKALKTIELFTGLPKEYVAEVELGSVSTTYDREGMITQMPPKAGWQPPVDASPIQVLIQERFLGKVAQVPPSYSAVSVGGIRAYEHARRGNDVELPAREVDIFNCDIMSYAYPLLTLKISCGAGTYIRSLAHDIGQGLRCGGYLRALTRTRVGDWSLDSARFTRDVAWTDVMSLKDVLTQFTRTDLTPEQWQEIRNGRTIELSIPRHPFIAWFEDLPVALLEADPKRPGRVKARKVL